MNDKRRGLGRGLGALIPNAVDTEKRTSRPTDVFFNDQRTERTAGEANTSAAAERASRFSEALTPRATYGAGREIEPRTDSRAQTHRRGADDSAEGRGSHLGGSVSRETATESDPTVAIDSDQHHSNNDGLTPVPGAAFAEIPPSLIRPNPKQPRTVFDEEDMSELVHSIREIGVLQPIVVRPVAEEDPAHATTPYELIMGERRWRASQKAGLETVPAIVRSTTDEDLLRDALLENLHRSQLNPLEEAAAYQQLLQDFGCTHDELAARIGRSRPQISNMIRLMKLPPLVQRRVAAGVISAGHARALLGMTDQAGMERLAQRIVAEGLSVRTTEEIVALGDDQKPRRAKSVRESNSAFDELAANLSDRLDTRVGITMGKNKGKVTVEFATAEDLDRIITALGLNGD